MAYRVLNGQLLKSGLQFPIYYFPFLIVLNFLFQLELYQVIMFSSLFRYHIIIIHTLFAQETINTILYRIFYPHKLCGLLNIPAIAFNASFNVISYSQTENV